LELFEKNKGFTKKDINLASLSKQFETNTKYLSEIIKTHRQKQFNSYLNELRVNYIVNRLQNEPKYINTKVSYLASDCGFASHSTFTTTFTQIMNESPSAF
ncbi:helix-turn-helix domain-containing protein, partial [Gilvimarinus sp. SDUM040013]